MEWVGNRLMLDGIGREYFDCGWNSLEILILCGMGCKSGLWVELVGNRLVLVGFGWKSVIYGWNWSEILMLGGIGRTSFEFGWN